MDLKEEAMSVIFRRKDFEADCKSINNILFEEKYGRVQNYLSQVFDIDLQNLYDISRKQGIETLSQKLTAEYQNSENIVVEKIDSINTYWGQIEIDVFEILNSLFKCKGIYEKEIVAEFSINMVCPRYLEKWMFDINYRKNIEDIIHTCIHEIIHFVWFEKWSEIFGASNTDEYNAPNTPWLLSEIAIDAIFKKTELKKYCYSDMPAYKHFYDVSINGDNLMEYFEKLFVSNSIEDFMKKGNRYVAENKEKIW